ncbi:MAG: hypothetical protein IMY76_00335 [Chloroflexi bacterium]|nr:hypothetical protein [Chloroflexota bacterium]
MSQNQQSRVAIPGDIFILLAPSAQELYLLRQKQLEFQRQYGGQIASHIHITSERLSPKYEGFPKECAAVIKHHIANLVPFPVFVDALIQFRAPYWKSHVLRWRVQDTDTWLNFREALAKTLKGIDCPSHFDRHRRSTCSILNLDNPITLNEKKHAANFPYKLFTAREMYISQLKKNYQFEILETIQLSGK